MRRIVTESHVVVANIIIVDIIAVCQGNLFTTALFDDIIRLFVRHNAIISHIEYMHFTMHLIYIYYN